ncbi:MAG: hypothetical protein KR126chlam1_00153 [Chlamydiae bacterium]|nr:hypothetical protein [Chlamydiota bacterium]
MQRIITRIPLFLILTTGLFPCEEECCYPPPFYDLECDEGYFLSGEFLLWYARESNLSYAVQFSSKETPLGNDPAFAPQSYKNLKTNWDPGFRIGIGWNSCWDGWDWYGHWTYFRNRRSDTSSVSEYGSQGNPFVPKAGETALFNPWQNPAATNGFISFDQMSAKWRLFLNEIDFEVGYKFWLSPFFTLRPFAGVRGAWTKTKWNLSSKREDLLECFDRFRNRYWGVGFVAGLQPGWYFCENFLLFANTDAALIWGQFEAKKRENYRSNEAAYHNTSHQKFYMMQAILDLSVGLRWEEYWCCNRYRTALDFAWEHHIWFDHNHRVQLSSQEKVNAFSAITAFTEVNGNLMMGGPTFRFRFDF